jgi:hypothetical protein
MACYNAVHRIAERGKAKVEGVAFRTLSRASESSSFALGQRFEELSKASPNWAVFP